MAPFRSDGISGYVGKKNMMRLPRRPNRNRKRFVKKIVRIIEKNARVKQLYWTLTKQKFKVSSGSEGTQNYGTLAIKNSGADVASIQSAINTITGITNSYNACFTVDTYILQVAMKNQSQASAIADLYELVPRVYNTTDPSTELSNICSHMNATNNDTAWGFTPFQCSPFLEGYKILRKTRYLLAPGALELVEIRETKPRKISLSKYYIASGGTASGSEQVPGYSKVWMLFVRGEPVHDATTDTLVSTGIADLDVVIREDYHYTFDVEEGNQRASNTNSLSAIAGEKGVLLETGAVVSPPVNS